MKRIDDVDGLLADMGIEIDGEFGAPDESFRRLVDKVRGREHWIRPGASRLRERVGRPWGDFEACRWDHRSNTIRSSLGLVPGELDGTSDVICRACRAWIASYTGAGEPLSR